MLADCTVTDEDGLYVAVLYPTDFRISQSGT
jgi:hypothetical protein